MRSVLWLRVGRAVAFLSACAAVFMGTTPAKADTRYHYEGPPVRLSMSGGNIPQMNACLAAVAAGGSASTVEECDEFATSGNQPAGSTVVLRPDAVTISRLPAGLLWTYSGPPVNVAFNGTLATCIKKYLSNSGIVYITPFLPSTPSCTQAFSGNTASSISTNVTVWS